MKLAKFRRLGLALILISVLEAAVSVKPGTAALGRAASSRLSSDMDPVEHSRLALLSTTPTSLSLEWTPPDLQVGLDSQGLLNIQAPGLDQTGRPGELRLPVDGYLLALPANAQANIDIVSSQEDIQPFIAPLALNPQPQGVLTDAQGRPVGGAWGQVERAGATIQSQPGDPVLLEEAGILRGVRLARLVFYPALPDGNSLRLIRRMQVKITWNIPVIADPNVIAREANQTLHLQDPLLSMLQQQVINPWMVLPDADQPQAEITPPSPLPGIYLEIDRTGLYRVTYQDLQPYGLTSFDPAFLHLYLGAQEVAYAWQGDGNAVFDTNEALLFYAEHRFSRWTELDAYRLVHDPSRAGSRMATLSAAPFGLPDGVPQVEVSGEENLVYTPDCFCKALPGRDGDHWVWHKLAQPDQQSVTLSFTTSAAKTGVPAQLILWMISYSERTLLNPDHQVKASLNTFDLGTLSWDGKKAATLTFAIPPGVLKSGQNTLVVSLPINVQGYYDQSWLDAFQVRYARSEAFAGQEVLFQAETGVSKAYMLGLAASNAYLALDVTDPLHPALLNSYLVNALYQLTLKGESNHRYWLASSAAVAAPKRIRPVADPWQYQAGGAPTGADYVIITHPDFASALQPLVALRQGQGYSVAVVNVLGIYDTWGDGRVDPQAIRAFLSAAYTGWQPRPTFVILVGDGSYDPRQNTTTQTTFIPPYLANADPWAGETAADNRYVAVAGPDFVPDMLLGRLPVQSLAQAQAVVSKIVQYEANAQPSPWNANVLMVSDDRDPAGDFYALNSTSSGFVASPFRSITLDCPDQDVFPDYKDNCTTTIAQQIHTSLLRLWPTGPFLIQYAGHSSWQQWAAERYFHLDDLPALQNSRQPTIVLEMTCFTGAFQRPEPTLDESLMLLPGNGAVAAWGSTGLGVSTGHDSLSHGFFQAVFKDDVLTVGQAALAGKLELLRDKSPYLDLLDTFNILGDPALHFNRQALPWSSEVFLPVISR